MAGNSRRRGAVRKTGTKKGAVVGSGGQRRRGLEGRGPTPKAGDRAGHPAQQRAAEPARTAGKAASGKVASGKVASGKAASGKAASGKTASGKTASGKTAAAKAGGGPHPQPRRRRPDADGTAETVAGRNPVLECLRAGVPATALHVAVGVDADERVSEAVRRAADAGVAILEVPRADLDRMTGGVPHQGLALTVPPYRYAHPDDVLAAAVNAADPALLVALDGVTDPRNLGAVVRSAAAFGAHGVLLPQRRSAAITAVAWRTSAGTATRLPVARATNLTRALRDAASAGLTVVGLDAGGGTSIDDLTVATEPLVIVVGGEGRGLSRLVQQTCDVTVSIPMASAVESLNASVAAGVVLAEVARRRRQATASA
jgi:23S rRNA (guanosine2251-2'-O)-methyltransferase